MGAAAEAMQSIQQITQRDPNYPKGLKAYLKAGAPKVIWARGDTGLLPGQASRLKGDLWALFCSRKCPGEIILKTQELAQQFKERGVPMIGGYHSPVEKDCLRVLLRGSQPILFCPARNIGNMRVVPEWKTALTEERLLILSIFEELRTTPAMARQRNDFAAALADKIFIPHAAEGSSTLDFARTLISWGKQVFSFDTPANRALFQLRTQPIESSFNIGRTP